MEVQVGAKMGAKVVAMTGYEYNEGSITEIESPKPSQTQKLATWS